MISDGHFSDKTRAYLSARKLKKTFSKTQVIAIGLGNHIDQEAKSRLEWFTGDRNAIFTTKTDDEREPRTSTIGN